MIVAVLAGYEALGVLLKYIFFPKEEPSATDTVTFDLWTCWRFIVFL